jgi:uncharacterized protein YjeT (DUF2065 family)
MSYWPTSAATKEDVRRIANDLEHRLKISGLITFVLGFLVTIWGILVELVIMADFGYVLIAIGVLALVQGVIINYVFRPVPLDRITTEKEKKA